MTTHASASFVIGDENLHIDILADGYPDGVKSYFQKIVEDKDGTTISDINKDDLTSRFKKVIGFSDHIEISESSDSLGDTLWRYEIDLTKRGISVIVYERVIEPKWGNWKKVFEGNFVKFLTWSTT